MYYDYGKRHVTKNFNSGTALIASDKLGTLSF